MTASIFEVQSPMEKLAFASVLLISRRTWSARSGCGFVTVRASERVDVMSLLSNDGKAIRVWNPESWIRLSAEGLGHDVD